MSKLTVLGFDPGTTNFAYGVTSFTDTSYKPVVSGKLVSMVRKTMLDLPVQFAAFLDEFVPLVKKYKPHVVVIERFMNRGKFSGDTGEYVSMMIALIVDYLRREFPRVIVYIVQPGNWKTAFNRNRLRGRKQEKGEIKPLDSLYGYTLIEPHELDAVLMTHYGFSLVRKETPYVHIVGSKAAFIEAIEAVALGKKKRKRK